MKRIIIYLMVATTLSGPAATWARQRRTTDPNSPRIHTLDLVPASIDTTRKYALLPDPNERTDGDAAVLYTEAVDALPNNLDEQKLRDWLRMPPTELPVGEVEQLLERARQSLESIERAVLRKEADWPTFIVGTIPADLSEYRTLARLLCLQARLHIARGQYDDAIGTMRTGLAMGRQIGESSTVIQGLVGVAVGAIVLQQVEALAQAPDSPNLYHALARLPRPLIDLEKPIAAEREVAQSSPQYNALTRKVMDRQMAETFDRVRQLMGRLNRDVAALQCIEAVRHYAATHDRQLPETLTDITGLAIPGNPQTEAPFGYRRDGSGAVLEAPGPAGSRPRDGVRYEITLAP